MSRGPRRLAIAASLLLAMSGPALAAAQQGDSLGTPPAPARPESTVTAPAPPPKSTAHEAAPPAHPATVAAPRSITPEQAAGAKPGAMCGICHSEVRVEFDRGVHKLEGLACTSCHGGDANATTVAAAHRAPFRGVPRRRDIPALCASCHSQVSRMRPYNLPSDQYALYQTSQHGLRLAKGDEKVAVCTDCHGVHEIRPPSDPKSSVFTRNIPATCGKCHGDPKLMHLYGRKDNPLVEYTTGVHGKALLEQGNNAAPECTRCHGSHSATPPGVGDVEKVCGQCHSKVRSYFIAGPHKEAMDAAGLPECAACHQNHKILPVTIATLDRVCIECHEQGSDEIKLAGTFKTMVTRASDEIDRAETLVHEAERIPLYVDDYKSRLTDARTALMEAYPVMHALDASLVEPHTRRAWSIASQVRTEIHAKLAGRVWRYVGLLLFWFYLLVTAAVLTRARRRAAAESRR
jgi:predicted CXXCH cytochrome family protein